MQNRGDVETFAQNTFPRRQDPGHGETFRTKGGDVGTVSGSKIAPAVGGFAPLLYSVPYESLCIRVPAVGRGIPAPGGIARCAWANTGSMTTYPFNALLLLAATS